MRLFVFLFASAILVVCEAKYDDNVFRYEGPPAPLAEDGRVIDTPEVAHARAMHLAAHAEALRRLAATPPEAYEDIRGDGLYQETSYVPPIASRNYLGPLDSQEVVRAYNQGATNTFRYDYRPQVNYETRRNVYSSPIQLAYTHNVPVGYKGPPAPLGPDGRVIDTPEVAQAKAAHMKAHAYAAALVGQLPSFNNLY